MCGLYQLSHFSACLECLVMALFLCSPEQVKHRSLYCCVLCMCTQHSKGECPLLMGLLEEGAQICDTRSPEYRPGHLLIGDVPSLCFCVWWKFATVLVFELYPSCFMYYTLHVSVLGRTESSFIFMIRVVDFLQYQWKDVAVVSLGKKKESPCLTYHAKTLGSNSRLKTENYLNLITISMSFLLKMWEHNT